MGWPARAVIIQKPVNRDQGPLPQEVLQGASLEHILGGVKLHWRAWQKCGVSLGRCLPGLLACACVCLGLDVSPLGPSGVWSRCLCEGE